MSSDFVDPPTADSPRSTNTLACQAIALVFNQLRADPATSRIGIACNHLTTFSSVISQARDADLDPIILDQNLVGTNFCRLVFALLDYESNEIQADQLVDIADLVATMSKIEFDWHVWINLTRRLAVFDLAELDQLLTLVSEVRSAQPSSAALNPLPGQGTFLKKLLETLRLQESSKPNCVPLSSWIVWLTDLLEDLAIKPSDWPQDETLAYRQFENAHSSDIEIDSKGAIAELKSQVASVEAPSLSAQRGLFVGRTEQLANEQFDVVIGPVEELKASGFGSDCARAPVSLREFRFRWLREAANHLPERSSDWPEPAVVEQLQADPAIAGIRSVREQQSQGFSQFDGNAGQVDLSRHVWSATQLETWFDCPRRFFVEHLLGARNDEADISTDLSPTEKGSLIHLALHEFLQRKIGLHLDPSHRWEQVEIQELVEIFDQAAKQFEILPEFDHAASWELSRDEARKDLRTFLKLDSDYREKSQSQPIATELRFGEGSQNVVELELTDKTIVEFRGSIDRVDETTDGSLIVIDYKTGSDSTYRVSDKNPFSADNRLQLMVYALAAEILLSKPVQLANYWFVTSRGGHKQRGFRVDQQVMESFHRRVEGALNSIRAGAFVSYPKETTGPFTSCSYCDPDNWGQGHARRRWEQLAHQPDLKFFSAIREPDSDRGTDLESSK